MEQTVREWLGEAGDNKYNHHHHHHLHIIVLVVFIAIITVVACDQVKVGQWCPALLFTNLCDEFYLDHSRSVLSDWEQSLALLASLNVLPHLHWMNYKSSLIVSWDQALQAITKHSNFIKTLTSSLPPPPLLSSLVLEQCWKLADVF